MALSVKGGSREVGSFLFPGEWHIHAKHEERPKPFANADGQPGGVKRGLGIPQDLLHLWDGGCLRALQWGPVERNLGLVTDRQGSKGANFSCPLLCWTLNTDLGALDL